jgi:hypothetical protein
VQKVLANASQSIRPRVLVLLYILPLRTIDARLIPSSTISPRFEPFDNIGIGIGIGVGIEAQRDLSL